jgi:putative transposase
VLRPQGFGQCRLYRVYKSLRLNLKRRRKRRLPERVKSPLTIPVRANEVWSADFMADAFWSERRFRTFSVINELNREVLKIEIDTSLPARCIVRALDELARLIIAYRSALLRRIPDQSNDLCATRSIASWFWKIRHHREFYLSYCAS